MPLPLWLRDVSAWIAIGGIVALVIGVPVYLRSGQVTIEIGAVISVGSNGSYPKGTRDTLFVTVRAKDGRQYDLGALAPALLGCKIGSQILLLRTSHSVSVDPRGCRVGASIDKPA